MSKLVISGRKDYVSRMYHHLLKEHPSTRRRMVRKGQAKFISIIVAFIVAGVFIVFFPLFNDTIYFGLNASGISKPEGYLMGSFLPYFILLIPFAIIVLAFRGGQNQNP